MVDIFIKYDDREARENLEVVERAARRGLNIGIRDASTQIARLMRHYVKLQSPPKRRTGLLRRNLRVKRTKIGPALYQLEITIRNREAFYAFILNAGYPNRKTFRFMEKSIDRKEDLYNRLIILNVQRAIATAIRQAMVTPPQGG